jgi:hypothetical protein
VKTPAPGGPGPEVTEATAATPIGEDKRELVALLTANIEELKSTAWMVESVNALVAPHSEERRERPLGLFLFLSVPILSQIRSIFSTGRAWYLEQEALES